LNVLRCCSRSRTNDVNFGWSASVWTTNLARTLRFSQELQFGTVWVNTHIFTASEMPFGGYGESD
jgi:acyl-CoA reductase-like NAD-dependent aldehyde dehydrogenase